MSVIFGLLGRNGQHVTGEDLGLMQHSYNHVPSDGLFAWRDGEVGLGVIQRWHTPESPHETFPQQSRCGRHIIISHSRLDNRNELLQRLEVPREREPFTPDSALLVMAFEQWGDACFERLAGDWVAAVWSRDIHRLLIAMGPLATCALFYATKDTRFAFSSTINGLVALPWVDTAPDLTALGYYLSGAANRVQESSFLKAIHALPPGYRLVLENGRMETRPFWNLEDIRPLRLRDEREYLDAFLEQYRRAVKCRLRTFKGVGATLSGGLDSGSVVALAAEALRPKGHILPVFSAVPRFDPTGCVSTRKCGDESHYILATAEAAENVQVNFLRSVEITPLSGISALTEAAGPIFGALNCFWMHDLLLTAQRKDLRVMLTGQGGNGTVSWQGSRSIRDHLQFAFTERILVSLAHWLRRQDACRSAKLLLKELLPDSWLWAIMHLFGKPSPGESFLTYTPLRREFIQTLDLKEHYRRLDVLCLRGSRELRHGLIGITATPGERIWYQMGTAHGVDVRDPTMDKELVEFLFSIPEYLYYRHNEDRSLIRRAMIHLLPDKVRYPSARGEQGADIIYRIRDSVDEVFAAFERMRLCSSIPDVLDLDAMQRVAARAMHEQSPELTRLCGSVLCRGLSAGLFLEKYS